MTPCPAAGDSSTFPSEPMRLRADSPRVRSVPVITEQPSRPSANSAAEEELLSNSDCLIEGPAWCAT